MRFKYSSLPILILLGCSWSCDFKVSNQESDGSEISEKIEGGLHTIQLSTVEEARDFYTWSADRIPMVSAHRGGPYPGFPENSLEAFANVLSYTPAIIELDVAMTKDSVLVLMHDDDLDRTTNGKGLVIESTYAEIQALFLEDMEGNLTEFKVPTLNDRFWNPGGNPDLLPEESISGEIGLNWVKNGVFSLYQSLTYYRMQVDNLIIWLPQGSVWSPQNIREVQNQGIEYQGKANWNLGRINWELGLGYTFSEALDLTSQPANPLQLPYTPKHQTNGNLSAEYAGIALNLSSSFVGERAIGTGNARILDSYQIWNAGLRFSDLKWGKTRFPLSFQVLNLLDRDYQVLYLRAMPGRSYQINLTIHL